MYPTAQITLTSTSNHPAVLPGPEAISPRFSSSKKEKIIKILFKNIHGSPNILVVRMPQMSNYF